MKLMRTVNEGLPDGYEIKAYAQFRRNDWEVKEGVFTRVILYKNEKELCNWTAWVYKPRATRKWFRKIPPKETWEQKCSRYIEEDIEGQIGIAHNDFRKDGITDGLFDSLAEVSE
jgi:hypothetical protein